MSTILCRPYWAFSCLSNHHDEVDAQSWTFSLYHVLHAGVFSLDTWVWQLQSVQGVKLLFAHSYTHSFRTLKAFEMWLKKGSRGTDYLLPTEMLVQINVIIEFKNQALKLCALDQGDNTTKVRREGSVVTFRRRTHLPQGDLK